MSAKKATKDARKYYKYKIKMIYSMVYNMVKRLYINLTEGSVFMRPFIFVGLFPQKWLINGRLKIFIMTEMLVRLS